jgi:lipopolysaccharide transport system permease protein
MAHSIWKNREFLVQMTVREVLGRYRGSILGLVWSLLNPIMLLLVYTFVFSGVFRAKWPQFGDSPAQFGIVIFVGMVVHGVLSEVLIRAPLSIVTSANYVKKVVFPLEILPVVPIGAALFHCMISLLVLMCVATYLQVAITWSAFTLPIVLFPLVTFTFGVAWLIASIAVYVRDVTQVVGVISNMLLFLSPVFFPLSALPKSLQPWMLLNPLTFIIEQARSVLLLQQFPDWWGLFIYQILASIFAWFGYVWFQRTRKGFADVL